MSVVSWAICAADSAIPGTRFQALAYARGDQGLVVGFVAAVPGEEAVACELGHLLADQLLLVEAVAQALLYCRRVVAEGGEQGVGAPAVRDEYY